MSLGPCWSTSKVTDEGKRGAAAPSESTTLPLQTHLTYHRHTLEMTE